jgi:hypothetical protein
MKSFRWILFLAFIVVVSCAVAGSVKEGNSGNKMAVCNSIPNKNTKMTCSPFASNSNYTLKSGQSIITKSDVQCLCSTKK